MRHDAGDPRPRRCFDLRGGEVVSPQLKKYGGANTREAGPVKGGTTVIPFVQGPDTIRSS